MIGRFLSIDPQTMLSQNLDPRFFNRYAYTFNDPVNLTDPHGECPWCVALAVIYVADKVYGAYDAAQTAKGIANGTIDPVDAAVEQGASQIGGLIAGPIGRQVGKKAAKQGEGVIYKRTNPKTGGCYIGQCKSQKRFGERKKEHDRDKGEQHEYEVLEDDIHADDLDYVEDTYIRDEGLDNLENKRHQMSETRRKDYERDQ